VPPHPAATLHIQHMGSEMHTFSSQGLLRVSSILLALICRVFGSSLVAPCNMIDDLCQRSKTCRCQLLIARGSCQSIPNNTHSAIYIGTRSLGNLMGGNFLRMSYSFLAFLLLNCFHLFYFFYCCDYIIIFYIHRYRYNFLILYIDFYNFRYFKNHWDTRF